MVSCLHLGTFFDVGQRDAPFFCSLIQTRRAPPTRRYSARSTNANVSVAFACVVHCVARAFVDLSCSSRCWHTGQEKKLLEKERHAIRSEWALFVVYWRCMTTHTLIVCSCLYACACTPIQRTCMLRFALFLLARVCLNHVLFDQCLLRRRQRQSQPLCSRTRRQRRNLLLLHHRHHHRHRRRRRRRTKSSLLRVSTM